MKRPRIDWRREETDQPYYSGDGAEKLVDRTPQQFEEMQNIDFKTEHRVIP
jgi:hypothetical protein